MGTDTMIGSALQAIQQVLKALRRAVTGLFRPPPALPVVLAEIRAVLALNDPITLTIQPEPAWTEAGRVLCGEADLDTREVVLYAGSCSGPADLYATLLHELVHVRLDESRHNAAFKRAYAAAANRLWGLPLTSGAAARMPFRTLDCAVAAAAQRAIRSGWPAASEN